MTAAELIRSLALLPLLLAQSCLLLHPSFAVAASYPSDETGTADVLFRGGLIFDGSGNPPSTADLGVRNGSIVFVGDADAAGYVSDEEIDVSGLWVAPGFIDAHSHAPLDEDYGRDAVPYLHQGITTVVLGMDGSGTAAVAERFEDWRREGIGVNAIQFVGHGAARREVMGSDNRAPSASEMAAMKAPGWKRAPSVCRRDCFTCPGPMRPRKR